MTWALVKNDEIVNIGYLPRKLNGIPEPQLNSNGWYKVIIDEVVIEPWQVYSSTYTWDSVNKTVTEVKILNDMTLEQYKISRYKELAKEINDFIFSKYPSYKQLSALAGFYDAATNQAIKDDVKLYFDKAQVIKATLFGYTTHAEVRDIYFRKNLVDIGQPDNWVFWGD